MVIICNVDSGKTEAFQYMGIEAFNTSAEWIDERNGIYQRRRDQVVSAIESIGLTVDPPKASLYVWARVPEGYTSAQVTELLLDEVDVVVTPGSGYGPSGEGDIRLSRTINEDDIAKGLDRLKSVKLPSKRATT